MAVHNAAKVPEGRARRIPLMGEPQPVLTAGTIERPPVIPNPRPMQSEPFSFPRERMPKPSYESTVPRPVEEADLVEFFDWGIERFLKIFPRATEGTVRPWLMQSIRAPSCRFVRTSIAFGLFYAERTPWEPELSVYDHFVVAQSGRHGEIVKSIAQRLEAPNIYKEGLRWANEIGAVTYSFGQATGIDLDPIAKLIGIDTQAGDRTMSGYTKVLRRSE
jgi:hypothetical protein